MIFNEELAETRANPIKTKTKGTANSFVIYVHKQRERQASAVSCSTISIVYMLIGRVHVYRFIRLYKNRCKGQMQVVNHLFANIFFKIEFDKTDNTKIAIEIQLPCLRIRTILNLIK